MRLRRVGLVGLMAVVACASLSPRPVGERHHVVVLPLADNALDFLYFAIAERAKLEAWFCLKGFVDRRTQNAVVSNISPVFVDSADGANIHGRPIDCDRGSDSANVIGTVHFHPGTNNCEFSDVDLITAHHLPYQIEAIMCRDSVSPRPRLQAVFRREIDSAYREIKKRIDNGAPERPRTYVAVYRYVSPPKP